MVLDQGSPCSKWDSISSMTVHGAGCCKWDSTSSVTVHGAGCCKWDSTSSMTAHGVWSGVHCALSRTVPLLQQPIVRGQGVTML